MSDARLGQGIMLQIPLKAFPGERALLTTPVNPLESQLLGEISESSNVSTVAADPIVLIMASQFGLQDGPPLLTLSGAPHGLKPCI